MLEKLYCRHCYYFLVETNLARWSPVVLTCPQCGEVNTFVHDPKKWVKKNNPDSEADPLPLEVHG